MFNVDITFLKIRHSQNYFYFSFTVHTEGKERVCVLECVCVRVCVRVCECVHVCMYACVCGVCACACATIKCTVPFTDSYIYIHGACITRGVHRTLTPRSQTLFHRLGTIPVEWA